MSDTWKKLEEARAALKNLCPDFPKIVVVLGSGLSGVLSQIEPELEFSYSEIPNAKPVSVEGHVSRIVVGKLGGTRIAGVQGRLHFYEGLRMEDVVFPVRALALAGAEVFILTNAAGGLRPDMKPLDLLLIRDHINLTGTNPLIGRNEPSLGPRFPDMTKAYDEELSDIMAASARKLGIGLHEGVYMGIHGPSYETPAEIRMYRQLGADVVGMSTVPEVIALRHMGRRVVGVSCVTNLAAGVTGEPLEHSDVLETAKKVYARFASLLDESVRQIAGKLGDKA